jgi:hypothetical protein
VLSGIPSSKGDYVFAVQAEDASGKTAQKEFFWHISDDLSILTAVLPDAAKGVEYKYSLEAKGGIPPYTWRLKSGTLPDGLQFASNGTISGKPAKRQTFSFTVEVNDSDSPAQTTQQTYIIDVLDTMFIATRSVPNARVDEAYTATLRAELGTPPYIWSVESGVLPPGIEIVSTPTVARLEGIPTEAGTYAFTIQVSDSGTPAQTRTFEYTMEVYGKLELDTVELKSAYVGAPYSENIIVSGGQLPYVWKIVGGALPTGLQLNQSTGHISGITSLGIGQSSEFTIQVIDSGIPSGFAERRFVIKVIEGIEIITFTIPKALQYIPFSLVLEGQGGISPYHWSLISGRLADGMSLNADTGELSGTPAEYGKFDFTVQMADSSQPQYTSTRAYSWEILENSNPPIPPTPIATPTPAATPIPGSVNLQHFSAHPVAGFELTPAIEYGPVPTDNAYSGATDGEGLSILLGAGQGVFLLYDGVVDLSDRLAELSVAARSTSNLVQMALVAIVYPVDGSLGYVNPIKTEVPVNRWGKMRLVYDSPTSQIIPVLQFVIPSDAPVGTKATIYVDSLVVSRHVPAPTKPVELTLDGTFDTTARDLVGLNVSLFLPQGAIPGFVSLASGVSGQGIRLELLPSQLAAHVALFSVPPAMPSMIEGSLFVKRESGEEGMLALVITDGEQSVGYFLKAHHLPLGEFQQIRVGGNFESTEKDLPPIVVVQLGGPDVSGSVVIDEVELGAEE